jgi:hypothetical protein
VLVAIKLGLNSSLVLKGCNSIQSLPRLIMRGVSVPGTLRNRTRMISMLRWRAGGLQDFARPYALSLIYAILMPNQVPIIFRSICARCQDRINEG